MTFPGVDPADVPLRAMIPMFSVGYGTPYGFVMPPPPSGGATPTPPLPPPPPPAVPPLPPLPALPPVPPGFELELHARTGTTARTRHRSVGGILMVNTSV